jgi:hypothetical protein
MRVRLPWLAALPLMAAGSLAAHALSLLAFATPRAGEGHELEGRSSEGVAAHTVMPVGLIVAVASIASLAWGWGRLRGRRGVAAEVFFALPFVAYATQEVAERLLAVEASPFRAAVEPRFLVGLALQVPFGALAFAAARLLARAVGRIARHLAAQLIPRHAGWSTACVTPTGYSVGWPIACVELGHAQRGPPRR